MTDEPSRLELLHFTRRVEPLVVPAQPGHQDLDGLGEAADLQGQRGHPGGGGAHRQVGVLGEAAGEPVADLSPPGQRRAEPGPGQHRGGHRDGSGVFVEAVAVDRVGPSNAAGCDWTGRSGTE
ncbi:hypothetical protein V1J52_11630 [Streptomyces sp. TRM 70351]|uniref:hypothetical protein n=1 Tax=Streptomyces sp. TRM 70351 TaxID=3116552 RepID=UPI002E7B9EF8|nr:hypothetical protein [Streptomyces sp. TRM 70351]MEE1928824.1 hypothetical protein [Streptomyces sp. TRM 70351]